MAAILGTIQSTFTDFKYLRKVWKETCNEERLLGVSLTGITDNITLMEDKHVLEYLKEIVVNTNIIWAERLGVNPSVATTCVKPSGTVSQLVDSSSGLHRRHSRYYLRTVRADNKDPVTRFLKDQGVYNEPDVMAKESTTVFYFAKEAPHGALTRETETALDTLNLWKHLQDHWCEHKPSATVNVREEEWMDVASWVYRNFDMLSGVSFLPYDGGSYKQAPYQELTEDEYRKWIEKNPMPTIDWSRLPEYETVDSTTGSQDYACTGGVCEVIEIGRPTYDG